ncbi:MAG: DUF1292 domain-containing protein [Ruminococcus sp.]|nr:DUF1292 domain-containing protein [Ruminococcus sp.]
MNDFDDNDEYFSSEEVQELMADIAGEIMDSAENDMETLTLFNEDGEEVEFIVLGTVDYQEKSYIVLQPTESEDNFTVILELVPDDETETCSFAPVGDDILGDIFDRFRDEHAGEFNFE